MTDSMIPYSFIPGMKAKAGEVNANFIALADVISQNKNDITDISEILENVTDNILPDEHFERQNITEISTNLDSYLQKGVYFFSSDYIPSNAPKNVAGTLIVLGDEVVGIKQLWLCDGGIFNIYSRNYSNSVWTDWNNTFKSSSVADSGYMRLPNNALIQWGTFCSCNITYPIAFATYPAVVVSKQGYSTSNVVSDEGFTTQATTGFIYKSMSLSNAVINWIAIGY